jgi:hypothetical protein
MTLPDEAYNAGKLLDAMRPEVEKLLEEHCRPLFHSSLPSCRSQAHRAIRAIHLLNERVDALHHIGAPCDRISELYCLRERLEKFLSVHRTVCLLEARYNNPTFDVYGKDTAPAQA